MNTVLALLVKCSAIDTYNKGDERMKKILFSGLLLALLTGCATTNYQAYEGEGQTRIGQGGTRTTVDGIDIWNNGEPPKHYLILGYIDDERGGGGLSNMMRNDAIAAKVKEAKGDAAIFINSNSQFAGMMSTGSAQGYSYGNQTSAFGTGFSAPMTKMPVNML